MSEYSITEAALRDFCELTLANELELAISSEAFRTEYRAELVDFFDRMRGLVSAAGYEACRTTLRGDGTKAPRPPAGARSTNKKARAKRASSSNE